MDHGWIIRLSGLAGALWLAGSSVQFVPQAAWAHGDHAAATAAAGEYKSSQARYMAPAVTLTDMNGVDARLADALSSGAPILVDFVFTTCTTICPVTSATYAEAQEILRNEGTESRLVSISIDPEYDSPPRLRAYAERFGARPDWRLFTGRLSDIVAVQKAFDAYMGNKANHVPLLLMHASRGAPWVRIEGFASASQIVEELHRMLSVEPDAAH